MAFRILPMLFLAMFFCFATAEQQNHRKNIQILFLPADVMRNMRKNHTEKELLPGFPGQGAKHWIPVRLPGNKTRSFEIRINPLLARKLHLNLQHFSIGHGYGLLLELKNVSLSSKGQTVLDRLVEFYKNCGTEEKFPRLNMTQRIRRPHPSLMLSGNIALMKRIQNALKHFSPKRLEGLKDVLKHKNSSGVVLHLIPLADMGQKVNKLIKRTMATRGCVKIKTNALTHALEVFRRQLGSDRNRTRVNKNESTNLSHGDDTRKTDVHENNNNKTNNNSNNNHNSNNNTNSINNHSNNNNRNNRNNTNQKSNEELKERKELSFPRDLKSSSIHPESKMNFESSSAINAPGSTAVTKIVPALTSLRKMITHVPLSGANKKASQSLVKKKDEGTSLASYEDENRAHVNTFTNDISSVNGKMNNEMGFELSEVKNVPNKMVIDTEFDDKRRKNNAGDGYNEGNVSETGSWNGQENNGAMASKMKTSQQDLFTSKAKKENDSIEDQRNGSKILAEFGGNDHNSRPVNQTVNPFQTVKGPKGIKDSKNVLALSGPPEQTTTTNNKQGRKGPSVTFYYKPTRLKLHIKGRGYVKEDHSEEDDLDSESYEGEGRFLKLVHMRTRKPRVKGIKPQDELNEQGEIAKQDKLEKQDNNQHRKFGDSPIDASYDGNVDNTKLRLEGEFRRLGAHGPEPHKPKLKRLKLHFKGRKYAKVKEGNDEDDLHSESYEGEGRFVKLIHMRRRKPHVKGMKLQDNLDEQDKPENQNNNQHRKFHDSPVDASYDGNEDNMKVRLGGNVLKLRGHSHASFIHRHKRPKIRVVLYDNNEEEKKERHNHSWRNGKSEKINEDDYEAESEPMDSENLGTYEQDNSESDVSDSIGNDDNSHLGRSKSAGEVPDLGPYLRKHFEDEEDEESREIKMYTDQDVELGNTIAKATSNTPKQGDAILDEPTMKLVGNDYEEPGRDPIQKLPFKMQEDSEGLGTSLLRDPPHNAFGQHDMDVSANAVMPPDESLSFPETAQQSPMTDTPETASLDTATFSDDNYQPSETTQMADPTPFPQDSSVTPMQTDEPNVGTSTTSDMQPGEIRAVISGRAKMAPKAGFRKTVKHKGPGLKKKHSDK